MNLPLERSVAAVLVVTLLAAPCVLAAPPADAPKSPSAEEARCAKNQARMCYQKVQGTSADGAFSYQPCTGAP